MKGTNLRIVARSEAIDLFRANLGDRCGDELTLNCSIARACLWALSGGNNPVHILRVGNLVVATWGVLQNNDIRGIAGIRFNFREALEALADSGDLVNLPNGYWVPAPLRQVAMGTVNDSKLLLGGAPSSLFPKRLADLLHSVGPFRRFCGNEFSDLLNLPYDSLEHWMGSRPPDIIKWADKILSMPLQDYRESEENVRFKIYAPGQSPSQCPQFRRWKDTPQDLTGRFFAWRELMFGVRQPRIVEVKRGRIHKTGIPHLGSSDARRLMYGLDAIENNPTQIEFAQHEAKCSVTLKSEIPRSEQRLFAAMGQLVFPQDYYYPRVWYFDAQYKDRVQMHLSELQVTIREGRWRRNV